MGVIGALIPNSIGEPFGAISEILAQKSWRSGLLTSTYVDGV